MAPVQEFDQLPCKFPCSQGICPADWFAADCLVSQAVGSPGYHFPVCENIPVTGGKRGWLARPE
jgi:hypothetical protein